MELKVSIIEKNILTHQITPIGPLPSVMDPDGVYPYQSYCETSDRPNIKKYTFVRLENNYLAVLLCPDLGGKVYSMIHKKSGKEVLYVPDVIRPSRILPRFSFVAGGIEVSFPISHTPSQNEKINYDISKQKGRIYVSFGEIELRYGMQWTVEYSLGEHDDFLTQRCVFYNPTSESHPWMSWSNAALPAFDDSEFHFPSGNVLMHSDELKMIDWITEGPKVNSEIENMSGYFWQDPDVNAFGCFSSSQKIGLYHVAERSQTPGIKLWSYGNGRDKDWSFLHSLKKQSYLEIQAGPILDQSIKDMLEPGKMHQHIEFWIPSDKAIDIRKLKVPLVKLRDISEVSLFSYARSKEVKKWQLLIQAFVKKDISIVQDPPDPVEVNWPVGPDLEEPLKWVIMQAHKSIKPLWKMYLGIWFLNLERIEESIEMLVDSGLDISFALLGRIYNRKGNYEKAIEYYNSIEDKAIKMHPQIIVERDKTLEQIGHSSLSDRKFWLDQVESLNDEFIIERRIDMLIEMDEIEEAQKILERTKFQKIHQRYERKKLWKKLCKKTNSNIEPYPQYLGEDNLAIFGKYREFDEN